jgi:hypothetical protein
MKPSLMKAGVRYIVTHASKDRELQVGDHVWLDDDGSIVCREAAGWMSPEDVPAATRRMTVELDTEWYAKRKAHLERQLAAPPPLPPLGHSVSYGESND